MKKYLLMSALALQVSLAPAAFVINEIDADQVGVDAVEFIELKGNPNESVEGLVLVLYNGGSNATAALDPKIYQRYALTGQADANGYYLVGNTGVPGVTITFANDLLQNGEDAVALYQGDAASYPIGASVTSAGLIDVVFYETGPDLDPTWTGFGVPVTTYDEQSGGDGTAHALARVPNVTGGFVAQMPTPGSANDIVQPSAANLTPTNGIFFGRFNESNEATPVSREATLTNTGGEPFTVTSFGLDPGTDPQFTVVEPATVPTTLQPGQNMQLTVIFSNAEVASSQVFEGSISYVSNAATAPTGTIPLTAEFIKVVAPATGPGQLIINEVVFNNNAGAGTGGIIDYNNDGNADTTQDEFIELYNPGGSPVNITGWEAHTLNATDQINTYIFGDNTIVPAGGFLVVFNGGNPTGFAAGTFTTTTLQFSNPGTRIGLGDGTTFVAGVSYLATNDDPDADQYTNLPTIANGNSVGRRPDGTNAWVEFEHDGPVGDRPTPGTSNNALSTVSDWQLF